jgi:hypothetical protein
MVTAGAADGNREITLSFGGVMRQNSFKKTHETQHETRTLLTIQNEITDLMI